MGTKLHGLPTGHPIPPSEKLPLAFESELEPKSEAVTEFEPDFE